MERRDWYIAGRPIIERNELVKCAAGDWADDAWMRATGGFDGMPAQCQAVSIGASHLCFEAGNR